MEHKIIQNIGLDIDGVIFDKARFQLMKGVSFFSHLHHTTFNQVIKDIRGYDIKDIFYCSDYERFLFWAFHILDYCFLESVIDGVVEITQKWQSEGRNIYIISGRKEDIEYEFISKFLVLLTKLSIYKSKVSYKEIHFCTGKDVLSEKNRLCEQLEIDLLIDDRIDILEKVKNICYVLCMNDVWNENIETDIMKIDNIYVADKFIRLLEK